MNKSSFFLKPTLLASLALALAFTISCSSGDKDDGDGEVSKSSSSVSVVSSSSEASSSSSLSNSSSSSESDSSSDSSSSSGTSSSSNAVSIFYGEPVEHGGETYQTVVIGNQTWMERNLNLSTSSGSWCYANDSDNCTKYGRLYDWATAMGFPSSCNSHLTSNVNCNMQINSKRRGICPEGYHIPTNAEWDRLYRNVDGNIGTSSPYDSPTAGKALKATSGWNDYHGVSGNGTDKHGFAALPGGYYYNGNFRNAGDYGTWWSASENDASYAYSGHMYYGNEYATSRSYNKSTGFSVRCLKD